MAPFWKKKVVKGSTSGLSPSERLDVISLYFDQDWKPSDIAAELNVDVMAVGRCLDAETKKRKRAGDQPGSGSQPDPVKELDLKIKQEELEMRLQEKKWAREDREARRQDELRQEQLDAQDELFGPVIEEMPAWGKLLQIIGPQVLPHVLPQLFGGSGQAASGPAPQNTGADPRASSPDPQGSINDAEVVLSEEQILQIMSEQPHLVSYLRTQPEEEQRRIIISRVPQLSRASLDTAIELINQNKEGDKEDGKTEKTSTSS